MARPLLTALDVRWLPRKLAVLAVSAAWIVSAMGSGCRRDRDRAPVSSTSTEARRHATLAAARVWTRPRTAPAQADFGTNTPGPGFIDADTDVACDFQLQPIGGTTPKFYCTTADGDRVKVKYGAGNPEIPADVAASRLLAALGFAVDRMMLVRSVRCRGCPAFPAQALECLQNGGPARTCLQGTSSTHVTTFEWAMIERPFPGENVDGIGASNWAWFELDAVDPAAGGSARAEVDALRLMAVLIAHWDNKAENQRLVCPPGQQRPDGSCRSPIAAIHDLGATFGPLKLDLQNWSKAPMWSDEAGCRVSMAALPFHGATFAEHAISEEGRRFALELLRPISPGQMNRLFDSAGVGRFNAVLAAARRPESWTDVFMRKVDEIARVGPCPSAADLHARGE
jgi:hypothetical protein